MAELVEAARAARARARRRAHRDPPARGQRAGFEVAARHGRRYLVRGEKPTAWVQQTDFNNDEAVGYLADRLARLGVEEALAKAGADPGDTVLIGDPATRSSSTGTRPDGRRRRPRGRPARHRPPPANR